MSRGAGSSSRGGGGGGGAGGNGREGLSDGLARAVFGAAAGFALDAFAAGLVGLAGLADAFAGAFPLCDLPFVFATAAP